MRWWMLALGACLFVLLLVPWRERRPARVDPPPTEPEPVAASEEAEPEAEPTEPAPAKPAEPEEPAKATARPTPVPTQPKDPPTVIMVPEAAGPLAELRGAYEADGPTSETADVERTIRDLFGSIPELPVDSLRHIECRERVCKVDIWWSEKTPHVYMALAMTVSAQQSHYVAVDPGTERNVDDELPLTVYVLRAGHELEELKSDDTAE